MYKTAARTAKYASTLVLSAGWRPGACLAEAQQRVLDVEGVAVAGRAQEARRVLARKAIQRLHTRKASAHLDIEAETEGATSLRQYIRSQESKADKVAEMARRTWTLRKRSVLLISSVVSTPRLACRISFAASCECLTA